MYGVCIKLKGTLKNPDTLAKCKLQFSNHMKTSQHRITLKIIRF